jgi:hypothetical protein
LQLRDRVAKPGSGIAKMPPASRAQVTPVRVNSEPILVQVRIPAQRTFDKPNSEAEYATHHIINGIELGDHKAAWREFSSGHLHGPKSAVVHLVSAWNLPSMYMDAPIKGEASSVVYWRNRAPERHATRELI